KSSASSVSRRTDRFLTDSAVDRAVARLPRADHDVGLIPGAAGARDRFIGGAPMNFAPLAPTTYLPPTETPTDPWLIPSGQPTLGQPLFVYLNSLVIRGEQPMIVDTGTIANREQWLTDVFSLVEPEDVRWIYLSHDDVDHSGNLEETLS